MVATISAVLALGFVAVMYVIGLLMAWALVLAAVVISLHYLGRALRPFANMEITIFGRRLP